MTYNPNIPNAGDFLSDSQGQLKTNFTSLNTVFSRNHIPFSTVTNSGKHTFVEMVNSAAIPTPVPALSTNTGTIYTKKSGGTGSSNIYYTNDNSGREYQLTTILKNSNSALFSRFATNVALTLGVGGFSFIAGNLLLQYGKVAHSALGTYTVTFGVPFLSTPYNVQATGTLSGAFDPNTRAGVGIVTVSTTGFTARTSTNAENDGFYWMAIGPYDNS